jgi:hypothetical protein
MISNKPFEQREQDIGKKPLKLQSQQQSAGSSKNDTPTNAQSSESEDKISLMETVICEEIIYSQILMKEN